MEQNKRKTGDEGELLAINFLSKNGYKIITTNYTIKGGEIDIVCEKNGKTIFFEVKYRKSDKYGTGEEAFTKSKRRSLLFTIKRYCFEKRINMDNVQIDFIAITNENSVYNLKHYENIEI